MGETIFESLPKEKMFRKKFIKLCVFGIGSLAANSMLFSSLSSTAYAHPPANITITYNPATKVLRAVIAHNVADPRTHYIKEVDIALNGREIIEHNLSRQDNNATQTVSYLIPDAKIGDIISLEAYCNISGKLKKEIKISK